MPEQKNLISQASSSQIAPSILPVSHDIIKNDNNTSLDNSTKEFPKPDGTSEREQGVNETQRGMQSRHLIMIGMCSAGRCYYVINSDVVLNFLFVQLLVVRLVLEYS